MRKGNISRGLLSTGVPVSPHLHVARRARPLPFPKIAFVLALSGVLRKWASSRTMRSQGPYKRLRPVALL